MSYDKYLNEVREELSKLCPEDLRLTFRNSMKPNGVILESVILEKTGRALSPSVYLKHYFEDYENGRSAEEIAREILSLEDSSPGRLLLSPEDFLDYEKMKEYLIFRLVRRDWNEELLKKAPHLDFMDLSVLFYLLLEEPDFPDAAVLVSRKHLKCWNISTEELYEAALINTPKRLPWECVPMETILSRIDPLCTPPFSPVRIQVLTNSRRSQGAACLLYPGVLKEISDRLESNLIIIPSSVHELLLLPEEESGDLDVLNQIISQINQEELPLTDWLSDHYYYYDRQEERLLEP